MEATPVIEYERPRLAVTAVLDGADFEARLKRAVERSALRLLSQPIEIGHPLFTAPGVPVDRVATLRKAFDESMRDPDFLKQAEAMKADVNPVSGDQLQKTVAEIVATPKAAAARLTSIIGASGL